MTPLEHKLLGFYLGYIARHGHSPNYDETCSALHLKSKSQVHRLITSLVEQGEMERRPNRWRAVRPVIHTCPSCGGEL